MASITQRWLSISQAFLLVALVVLAIPANFAADEDRDDAPIPLKQPRVRFRNRQIGLICGTGSQESELAVDSHETLLSKVLARPAAHSIRAAARHPLLPPLLNYTADTSTSGAREARVALPCNGRSPPSSAV